MFELGSAGGGSDDESDEEDNIREREIKKKLQKERIERAEKMMEKDHQIFTKQVFFEKNNSLGKKRKPT